MVTAQSGANDPRAREIYKELVEINTTDSAGDTTQAVTIRGFPIAEHSPSWYFENQCFISGDGGDPGFRQVVDAGLTDCLLAASDFPHPESPDFPHAIDKFFDHEHARLDNDTLRKIFWDNPARLYHIK